MWKRIVAYILIIAIFVMSGCGPRERGLDANNIDITAGTEKSNINNAELKSENSQNMLQYQRLALPEFTSSPQQMMAVNGYVCFLSQNDHTQYACRMRPDGSELSYIPLIQSSEIYSIACISFCEMMICYAAVEYTKIDNQQLGLSDTWLRCITVEGEELFSIEINETYKNETNRLDTTVTGIAFTSDNTVLFTTPYTLYHVNREGEVLNSLDIEGQMFSLVSTSSQEVLLWDLQDTGTVYPLNMDSFSIGSAIMNNESIYGIYNASDNCDFFAVYEDGIYAVTLSPYEKSIIIPETELSGVEYVFPIEAGKWLVSHVNYLNFEKNLYIAEEMSEASKQEKETLTLAISDAANFDDYVQRFISQYHFENPNIRIQVAEYQDDELKRAFSAGEAPDLILFDTMQNWKTMNYDLLSQRGLLVDLIPYIDTDEGMLHNPILPGILTALVDNNTLFSIPYGYQFRTMYCRKEYGASPNWSLSQLIEVGLNLPEGVNVEETTQEYFLYQVMQWCLPEFVDESSSSCNFETKLFYDLLELCKKKMPSEDSEDNNTDTSKYLCNYAFSMFGFGALCDVVDKIGDAGIITGFPDAEGGQFAFSPQIAITTANRNKEASWDFIRKLLMANGIMIYESILVNAFEDEIQKLNSEYSKDTVAIVSEMILDAKTASDYNSLIPSIVVEEAAAFFTGDKAADEVASIIQDRVLIYLNE